MWRKAICKGVFNLGNLSDGGGLLRIFEQTGVKGPGSFHGPPFGKICCGLSYRGAIDWVMQQRFPLVSVNDPPKAMDSKQRNDAP